jgi:hypothetical protein
VLLQGGDNIMTAHVDPTKGIIDHLNKEISSHKGFIGVCLDEETVRLLETKLAEQGKKLDIWWFIAVDRKGRQVFVVPKERIREVKTFATQAEGLAHMKSQGEGMPEEVEGITIIRWPSQSPESVLCGDSAENPGGGPCLPKWTGVR